MGALIGGVLCDRYGRKTIYQYDMLFYAFGMLWLVFASAPWMIVTGFVLVGLAVGADIPASWSLIAELAPDTRRGKHSGVAQLLWYLGPVVVLGSFLILEPLGLTAARIVFGHLALLALVLTLFRSRMHESQRWCAARDVAPAGQSASWRQLLQPRHLRSMAFLVGMYGLWNLWAGTNGFFFPYILRTVGNQTQAMSIAVTAGSFLIGMASIYFVFMRFADRMNQRWLFAISAILQIVGMGMMVVLPLTLPLAIVHVVLMSVGGGFGAQSFFQLWSSELFPTMLRSTAQGIMFAAVRIGLGIWSLFVPLLVGLSYHSLAALLTLFLIGSAAIGMLWAPRNEGKSLEQLDAERNAEPGLAAQH